jgi:thioredoxin 1
MANEYQNPGPAREEVDARKSPLMLEFGVDWCPHCQAAAPIVAEALAEFPSVEHLKVEDGKGRPLGRSFKVKLWPTVIFLKEGVEVGRAVRPESVEVVRVGLELIADQ